MLRRRQVLAGGATLLAGADLAETSLRDLARRGGLVFGSEMLRVELQGDPAMAALAAREAGAMVPGHEAKWDHVQPAPKDFRFADLDWLMGFAAAHDMQVRLHCLLWEQSLPQWVKRALANGTGASVLETHIRTVVGRYQGRARAWDVANEVADPRWPSGPEGLSLGIWRRYLGPDYVATAFRLAHEADPHAVLFVNDNDLEYDDTWSQQKRDLYLRLVEGWRKAGVPVGGFGFQSHLTPARRLATRAYPRFLAELAGMGLELHITEMDVVDRLLPGDFALRDRAGADLVGAYLDMVLPEKAVTVVMCWGLSDRYTWLNEDPAFRRLDGLPCRSLPYDDAMNAKPMRAVLADALARRKVIEPDGGKGG